MVSQSVSLGQLLASEVPALDLEVASQVLLEALQARLATQVAAVLQVVRVCCPWASHEIVLANVSQLASLLPVVLPEASEALQDSAALPVSLGAADPLVLVADRRTATKHHDSTSLERLGHWGW